VTERGSTVQTRKGDKPDLDDIIQALEDALRDAEHIH